MSLDHEIGGDSLGLCTHIAVRCLQRLKSVAQAIHFSDQRVPFVFELGGEFLVRRALVTTDAFGCLFGSFDDLIGSLLGVGDNTIIVDGESGVLGVGLSLYLDSGCPVAGFGFDRLGLLSGATQDPVFRIEYRDHGAVDRLSLGRTALLRFEFGLLETCLRILRPPLEFTEVGFEFAQELLDFTLVVALAARPELACVDR